MLRAEPDRRRVRYQRLRMALICGEQRPLILDDMGLKHLPKRSGEYLFEIIMRRHQLRSTMMTSNRALEDWGKLIGDVPAATAILDRLVGNAEIIELSGKSYRRGSGDTQAK